MGRKKRGGDGGGGRGGETGLRNFVTERVVEREGAGANEGMSGEGEFEVGTRGEWNCDVGM